MSQWGSHRWGMSRWGVGGAGTTAALQVALSAAARTCATLEMVTVDPITLLETPSGITLPQLTDGSLRIQFRDNWLEEDMVQAVFPDPTGAYLTGQTLAYLLDADTRYRLVYHRVNNVGSETRVLKQLRLTDRASAQYDPSARTWTLQLEDAARATMRLQGDSTVSVIDPNQLSYTDIIGAATATLHAVNIEGLNPEGLALYGNGTLGLALGWYLTHSHHIGRQRVHVRAPWPDGSYQDPSVYFPPLTIPPTPKPPRPPSPFDPNQPWPANRGMLDVWTGNRSFRTGIAADPSIGGAPLPPVEVTYDEVGDWWYNRAGTPLSGQGYGFTCTPGADAGRVTIPLPVRKCTPQRQRPGFNSVVYELIVLLSDPTTTPPATSTLLFLPSHQEGWDPIHPFNLDVDEVKTVIDKRVLTAPLGSFVGPVGGLYDDYCRALLRPQLAAANRVTLTIAASQYPLPLGTEVFLRVPEAEVAGWYRVTSWTLPLNGQDATVETEWVR